MMTLSEQGPRDQWKAVREWPRLSAEAKLAWQYLFELAEGRVEISVHLHPAAIGLDQGQKDALRSGKRCLETLEGRGLLDIRDTRATPWAVFLHDPCTVQRGRLRRPDPQGELFEEAEPAAVAQLPPVTCRGTSTSNLSIPQLTSDLQRPGTGDSCATAAGPDEPTAAAFAFGQVVGAAKAAVERQPEEAAKIVARVFAAVDDPKLSRDLCLRLAWEILYNVYPRHKLEGILHKVKTDFRNKPACQRGQYFVAAISRSYREETGKELTRRKAVGE
ncbi:MAG: hypothetical protein L0Y70_18375 [Gemmataceae bacterium]|nr:hypothetical protein [Gemmataceae bacterium]